MSPGSQLDPPLTLNETEGSTPSILSSLCSGSVCLAGRMKQAGQGRGRSSPSPLPQRGAPADTTVHTQLSPLGDCGWRPQLQQAVPSLDSHSSSWLRRSRPELASDPCHWECERPPGSEDACWKTAGVKKEESAIHLRHAENSIWDGGEG